MMWALLCLCAALLSRAEAFSAHGGRAAFSTRWSVHQYARLAADSDVAPGGAGPVTANTQARSSVRRSLEVLSQAALVLGPWTASAAKAAPQGAFEMDAEFYLRNLLQIQDKQKLETRGAIFKSPRRINKNLADDIIKIMTKASGVDISEAEIAQEVAKNLGMFREFAPIISEDNSDQYYFDLSQYAVYLIIARRLPESRQRVAFRARVGQGVLDAVVSRTPLLLPLSAKQPDIARGIGLILKCLQTNGLIAGYKFDEEDFGDEVFTSESFKQGLPVSTSIQLVEPANILSFIQGAKADTFFHPEWVGTTLSEYVERCGRGALTAKFEDYLLDNVYRESNFIVQAQDVLIEIRMGRADSDFK